MRCTAGKHELGHPFIVRMGHAYCLPCYVRRFRLWPRVALTPCQQHGIIHS